MKPVHSDNRPAWQVGRSIAMELDVILTGMFNPTWTATFSQEFQELNEQLPQPWLEEWQKAFGKARAMISFLETLAFFADGIGIEDYQAASLLMRRMDLAQVREGLEAQASRRGLRIDPQLTPDGQIVELGMALFSALYDELGLKFTNPKTYQDDLRFNFSCLVRVLRDGDLHDWFWMWLDRFYFQVYQVWRQSREELMGHNEAHARMELGDPSGKTLPPTGWLPEQNPLVREPVYLQAVREEKLRLFFWVDPFGLADLWGLYPGLLIVSFSEPGEVYRRFIERADDLARRAQALADPTRLGILRIIRHFGMINTEIGKFMGVSRPTVSIHAKILREAGLIRSHEEGREMKHEIVPGELQRLFRDLQDFLDLPDEDRME